MNTDEPQDWFEDAKEQFEEELSKSYDESKENDLS